MASDSFTLTSVSGPAIVLQTVPQTAMTLTTPTPVSIVLDGGLTGPPGTTDYNLLTNKPDLTGYATTTALTTGLAGKQATLVSGTSIKTINGTTLLGSGDIAISGGGGTGTVTSVSVTAANGVTGSVATASTTPAISLTLGAITPSSVVASGTVAGSNLSGTNTGDETVTTIKSKLGITTLSGSNTGDQTIPTALPPNGIASGDLSGSYPGPNVAKINGTALSGLATGILKNTTTTGVPSIAAAGTDYVVPSGSITGSAATLTTARTIGTLTGDVTSAGSTFNGSANNTNATVVGKINGVALSGLATGILKNTTTTGVPSIAVAADFPTLNQNTTGTAAGLSANITESQVTNLTTDLAGKQATLVSATNIKTINGASVLGSGDLVVTGTGGGSGTVTTVSIVSANGLAGTVATDSTTPAITLSTSVTGVLKGNGTAISAATAETDYTTPTGTGTLTNKRVARRTNTTASSAAPAINTDTTDEFTITALAAAITSMTTSLTGTPANGDTLMIRIKDNGTARAITWGASFASSGVATLLATTVANKTHYVGLRYDSTAAKWVCLAVDATGY